MRKCIFLILLFHASVLTAQDSDYVRSDTMRTSSGFIVYAGQELKLGIGNLPNGDFRYINVSTSSFYYISHKGHHIESSLSKININHNVKVIKIITHGSSKKGYLYYPVINVASVPYQIDIDGAIATGEIVVPDEFKPNTTTIQQSQEDVYDKIKKLKELLDSGAITQEEYDTQKKRSCLKSFIKALLFLKLC